MYASLYSGMKKCRDERLPLPIRLCQVGIIIIGIGSFLFHTTLQYGWQLADELPMIFGAAFSTYVIFDIGNPNLPRTRFVRSLPYLLSLYSFGVTAIYLRYRDPVFHQLAFGAIQLLSTSRSVYLIVTAPKETYREQKNKSDATRYILIGSATFLLGFLIWNVDNVLCDQISRLKEYLGTPLSFILEGHAWWHLATGTGSYLSGVGLQLLALSLKEGADGFEIKHAGILGLVPHIARTPINANAKLQ
ncbi:hypothetical protein PGT21_010951 [Puccinia graminis f. sp. tritici]|uniref:Alkaline ceramidase 3 n=1 Tax=Puccinia graminis f. sp. tritici TaxID=56615 RepID=A0A5B0SCR0_PUCGR|nr:hypothetical protein PGT21_010951 [Puccinia graminis f. sp. tritici]KAA1068118.1 hypothetical protein PGTUg99_018739 [Puccinia graminis f. sp. tritici]KAA1135931.1 hypothetical protein PGTUg99_002427 [Puccinia graminis f. sp. tritici]